MMAMRRRIAIPTVMSSSREYAWEAESAKLDVWA
jgi:hypothetical protein